MRMEKAYDSKEVEDKIYNFWEKSGFFNPDKLPRKNDLRSKKKTYTIVIPPPNITGSLHMGHALNAIVQDILIRKKRMEGYKTLWLPGTDHAGIATQNVIEKELKKEGKTRFDLGKEKFTERVWQWKEKYGNTILNQFKKIGASCDWSRIKFTMDKDYSQAVKTAFLHYYERGWIYQGERVINWCPRCQTSLSDLELEYKEKKGHLWYIKYPLVKNSKLPARHSPALEALAGGQTTNYIVVATTRPETMLGDTAVAVNPHDGRYKNLVGKKVILPLVNKTIPIIADRLIDIKFGTGVLKVTPGHDLVDYEIAQRHNLEMIKIIGEDGKITKNAPIQYQNLKTSEAQEKIVEDLKKINLLEKIEEYTHKVPYCYRCNSRIESIPSRQWFLKMERLAKIAEGIVKKGKIKFYPKRFEKGYFDWLKNIRDWCISRQIWWGHQLPIWYCENSEQKIKNTTSKMGFAGDVVPQVFDNKTRTYRLRDHGLKIGNKVAFENSITGEIFGTATITEVQKTTVGRIDLKDKKHWKTYNRLEELIAAFKRHYPEKEINTNTSAWIYTYKFDASCPSIVNEYPPKKCSTCGCKKLKQAKDVLDTWFSAALWPFAVFGWPLKKNDLERFYPTDVLSTARDIINLWVARMIFSGMELMEKIPFKVVYIHPTVLTKEGKRMSKSLGTGTDPLELIEKYGADATRFGIAYQIGKNQDIRFTEENIIMGKKFCNKLWNAARFVLMNKPGWIDADFSGFTRIKNLMPADKKILKTLNKTIKAVNKNLENFEFGKAAQTLYHFFWHEFCDIYIEKSKKQLQTTNSKLQTTKILLYVLLTSLKLFHPFIPFITEEIYQNLPIKNKKTCLMIKNWPI